MLSLIERADGSFAVWERESEGQLVVNFLRHNTYKVRGRIGFVSVLQRRNHQRFWLDSAEWQLASPIDCVRYQLEQDPKLTPQTVNHRLGTERCCYRFHTAFLRGLGSSTGRLATRRGPAVCAWQRKQEARYAASPEILEVLGRYLRLERPRRGSTRWSQGHRSHFSVTPAASNPSLLPSSICARKWVPVFGTPCL